jgi:hypothetical protein
MLKNDDRVGTIQHLGANYVVVESKGETWRCWLGDVSKVDDKTDQYGHVKMDYVEADYGATPELGPYRLSEGKSMYADKPDWGTPESTKKAKKMTPGEQQDEQTMDNTRDRIAKDKAAQADDHRKEKQQMKLKHDRLLDRARRSRMLQRNRGVKS